MPRGGSVCWPISLAVLVLTTALPARLAAQTSTMPPELADASRRLQREPTNLDALFAYAEAAERASRPLDAARAYQRMLLRKSGRAPELRVRLARAYEQAGQK